ncbi:hypothetical protein, partial [Candidatus Mycoplasma haematohominis]|uniref:hypothetical protein n=1 Tax=Candidatus Mycoplasma haematohominis TaxID=1494318 RepID=UPI003F6F7F60
TTIANSVNKDSYAAGTIGGDNKDKFVDPLLADNEGWWKGVFETLKQDKGLLNNDLSVEFNAVTEGFHKTSDTNNGATYLNKVCDTAIKKKPEEAVNSKYLKNIWKYCSINPNFADGKGGEPEVSKTQRDKNDGSITNDKLGGIDKNKGLLVADHEDNTTWWNWTYENKLKPAKAKATASSDLDSAFNAVTGGYGNNSTTDLNKVCETHYKKTASSDFSDSTDGEGKNKRKKNVEQFCTKGGNVTLSLS